MPEIVRRTHFFPEEITDMQGFGVDVRVVKPKEKA